MVKVKGKGPRARTRAPSTKHHRDKGMPNVNKYLQKFKVGQRVHIKVNSSVHAGMPYRRFWGKTGTVMGTQGECYLVQVTDMAATKVSVIHPVHLKAQA